jgi:O-antigen ligase
LVLVPLIWWAWQCLAATQTVDGPLTSITLSHFTVCVAAYYLGLLVLSRTPRLHLYWLGFIGGFLVLLILGWRQHFGGLAETRHFFYSLPNWREFPPEFIQKLASDRIYSTMFYPNALAGAVLLFLPAALGVLWSLGRTWTPSIRALALGGTTVLGLGCLYWSGSKAGWLIAMVQGLVVLLRTQRSGRIRMAVMLVLLAVSLAGFWVKYRGYFARGATSVSARLDYWASAGQTLNRHPLLGSGPGTFLVTYAANKRPGAEMARLTHNDYLQQGSDSGWPGLLSYLVWWLGGLTWVGLKGLGPAPSRVGVWVGLVGLAIQAFVEFWLYIPSIAWPACLLMGWLVGSRVLNPIDKPAVAA